MSNFDLDPHTRNREFAMNVVKTPPRNNQISPKKYSRQVDFRLDNVRDVIMLTYVPLFYFS